jgi:hypothetical protein
MTSSWSWPSRMHRHSCARSPVRPISIKTTSVTSATLQSAQAPCARAGLPIPSPLSKRFEAEPNDVRTTGGRSICEVAPNRDRGPHSEHDPKFRCSCKRRQSSTSRTCLLAADAEPVFDRGLALVVCRVSRIERNAGHQRSSTPLRCGVSGELKLRRRCRACHVDYESSLSRDHACD